mmetsp:Transcript_53253/g.165413  ORF Transcript_53253/g.165413 Transcript_53253/m.165413 type:complete len:205 (-) Transcript_53253:333-947(-)
MSRPLPGASGQEPWASRRSVWAWRPSGAGTGASGRTSQRKFRPRHCSAVSAARCAAPRAARLSRSTEKPGRPVRSPASRPARASGAPKGGSGPASARLRTASARAGAGVEPGSSPQAPHCTAAAGLPRPVRWRARASTQEHEPERLTWPRFPKTAVEEKSQKKRRPGFSWRSSAAWRCKAARCLGPKTASRRSHVRLASMASRS